jgi:putative membrane protein
MKVLVLIAASSLAMTQALAAPSSTDMEFVTKAAQAGMAEVAAGKVAERNGQSAAVKAFGKRMVTDHTKAGDELKQVAAKSGAKLPSSPAAEQQEAGRRLEGMKGADFDRAYAEQMVKDHQEAVALFQNEASSGSDAGLKSFAQKTLPTLEEHLRMAQALPEGAMSKAH